MENVLDFFALYGKNCLQKTKKTEKKRGVFGGHRRGRNEWPLEKEEMFCEKAFRCIDKKGAAVYNGYKSVLRCAQNEEHT